VDRGSRLCSCFASATGVIEPYGGMTAEGAECRANYLLKWEAIRTSREQGAVNYDMWGLSHEGIEQFKSGFGGREIRYVGAWDFVLDPAGASRVLIPLRQCRTASGDFVMASATCGVAARPPGGVGGGE